jgi:hypothetical protein
MLKGPVRAGLTPIRVAAYITRTFDLISVIEKAAVAIEHEKAN